MSTSEELGNQKFQLDDNLNPDITLKDFIDLLKLNNITYRASVFDWNGHTWVYPNVSEFNGENIDNLRFDFKGSKPNSKLSYVEFKQEDELGVVHEYRSSKLNRPWYKGGEII